MLNISETSESINKRFFQAIDFLRKENRLKGLETFAKKYAQTRGNLHTIKTRRTGLIKAECLAYLCRDFGISAEWLLLGKGDMLTHNNSKT